jgi:hypothetical protein
MQVLIPVNTQSWLKVEVLVFPTISFSLRLVAFIVTNPEHKQKLHRIIFHY